MNTSAAYVPVRRHPTIPGASASARRASVWNGASELPVALSEPLGDTTCVQVMHVPRSQSDPGAHVPASPQLSPASTPASFGGVDEGATHVPAVQTRPSLHGWRSSHARPAGSANVTLQPATIMNT